MALYTDWWIIQVFIVVLLTLIANLVSKHFFAKLETQLQKTVNLWDDALLHSIKKPTSYLIWLIGLSTALKFLEGFAESSLFSIITPIRDVLVIVLIAWFLIRFISEVEATYLKDNSKPRDTTTIHAISKLLRLSVLITTALVILQSMGYSISGVLAFGGIGGVAVGFAAKDLLANFFGGLMLYLDRPFKVGDWIRSPDREIEGTVEEIGWRLTRIRTFDKRPLYVPNSMFANITVQNPSRMTNRRIYETIGVRYDDINAVHNIVNDVTAMLKTHPDIDTNQTLIVNFNAFAPSSLDFFLYSFTKTTDWVEYHRIKQDVLLKIAHIIEGHDAEIAYPTSTVHLLASRPPQWAGTEAK